MDRHNDCQLLYCMDTGFENDLRPRRAYRVNDCNTAFSLRSFCRLLLQLSYIHTTSTFCYIAMFSTYTAILVTKKNFIFSFCTTSQFITTPHIAEVCTPAMFVSLLVKGKAIPLQAWTGPEGSRRLRLPDFKTFGK